MDRRPTSIDGFRSQLVVFRIRDGKISIGRYVCVNILTITVSFPRSIHSQHHLTHQKHTNPFISHAETKYRFIFIRVRRERLESAVSLGNNRTAA